MSRSGSGVYSPTAGVPVVSGTTISSTVFNNLITDIGNEITASLPVAGTAPMTGALRAALGSVSAPGYTFSGDTNTGIYSAGADTLNFATAGTLALTVSSTQTTTWAAKATGKAFDVDAITSVASATTTDIGAAATSEVLITGTTTITGLGTSNAGIRRRGRFAAALTLTHNATSLILPGAANITTAAGDSFEAVSLGSGNWQVTSYTVAADPRILTLGTSQATTSGTSIDFTGIPATVKRITIMFTGVSTSGTNNVLLQIGSGSVDATSYTSGNANVGTPSTATATNGFLLDANAAGANANTGIATLVLFGSNIWVFSANLTNAGVAKISAGSKTLAGALDRIRLTTNGGTDTFDAGSINIMYE